MSRKKKPLPVLENITITDFAAEENPLPESMTWWSSCHGLCLVMSVIYK